MDKKCQNCNSVLQGNYCSNCGQKAATHKINTHFLCHEIQHGMLHLDRGILFTTKELFTNAGQTIRFFLEGKRVKHFKPISFVLLLAGVYGFLSHYFQINMLANNIQVTGSGEGFDQAKEILTKLNEWISEHYSIVSITLLPIFAIGTYWGFFNKGYNFIEHLVINAYLTGQRLIVHLLAFPFYYYYSGTTSLRTTARITDIVGYTLTAWAIFQLFNNLSKGQRFWRTLLSLFISFLITFLLLTAVSKYFISGIK